MQLCLVKPIAVLGRGCNHRSCNGCCSNSWACAFRGRELKRAARWPSDGVCVTDFGFEREPSGIGDADQPRIKGPRFTPSPGCVLRPGNRSDECIAKHRVSGEHSEALRFRSVKRPATGTAGGEVRLHCDKVWQWRQRGCRRNRGGSRGWVGGIKSSDDILDTWGLVRGGNTRVGGRGEALGGVGGDLGEQRV